MERTKLIEARKRKYWTQQQAAVHMGIDANTLYRWEKGIAEPRGYNIERLCEVYGMTPVELGIGDDHASFPTGDAALQVHSATHPLRQIAHQDLTIRFMHLLLSWPRQGTHYHQLQIRFMQAIEDLSAMNDPINRREALRRLALLPIEVCGLSPFYAVLTSGPEEILIQCAGGITACWYLRKGKELRLAFDVVSTYIPTLKTLSETGPKRIRQSAADLLVQCLLLKATLARHLEGSSVAVHYAEQAEKYSEQTDNPLLHVLSLRTLAAIHSYANHWDAALYVAQKAQFTLEKKKINAIPMLVHSYVYAGLATYQAHRGEKYDALSSLKKAHETFFSRSTDNTPIWIDHNEANLLLNDGMAHFYLGLHKQALDSFGQLDKLPLKSELIAVEGQLDSVMAEIHRDDKTRDMEWCITQWTQGIEGAKILQSEQRFNEALIAYSALRAAWPNEQRIKNLREHTTHW